MTVPQNRKVPVWSMSYFVFIIVILGLEKRTKLDWNTGFWIHWLVVTYCCIINNHRTQWLQLLSLPVLWTTVSPPYPQVPEPWIQPSAGRKYLGKNPESSKKAKFEFARLGNYSHSIYIVLTTIYIALTLY